MNTVSEEGPSTPSLYYQTIQPSQHDSYIEESPNITHQSNITHQLHLIQTNRFYYKCCCLAITILISSILFTLFLIYVLNAVQCEKYLCELLLHHDIFSCIEDEDISHRLIDIRNEICFSYS